MKKFKNIIFYSGIFISGMINSLLGAGGGILVITILSKLGLSPKKAHATSICIILPICIFSAFLYIYKQRVKIIDAIEYIPGGVLGSIIGAFILSKIDSKILKKIFGIFVIWAALQLLLKWIFLRQV